MTATTKAGRRLATLATMLAVAPKPKTTLVPGGYPAELVAKGDVELVARQISFRLAWFSRFGRCPSPP